MDQDLKRSLQPKIFIADDHAIVLHGLQQLVNERYPVVGVTSHGEEVIQMACRLQPDCILLDISLGDINGFEVARELKSRQFQSKIIFVTMHTEPTFVKEAFLLGADGYVLKHSAASELFNAIELVTRHRRYISTHLPEEVREIAEGVAAGMPFQEYSGRLTGRQQKVLCLLAKGYSSKKIANDLSISLSTVAFHKTNIMRALGVHSSAELTKYAIRAGFVSMEQDGR
jgi:DNA-binding NarL/FixJ family response regulator